MQCVLSDCRFILHFVGIKQNIDQSKRDETFSCKDISQAETGSNQLRANGRDVNAINSSRPVVCERVQSQCIHKRMVEYAFVGIVWATSWVSCANGLDLIVRVLYVLWDGALGAGVRGAREVLSEVVC